MTTNDAENLRALANASPWYRDGMVEKCIHCRAINGIEPHFEECDWEEARRLVRQLATDAAVSLVREVAVSSPWHTDAGMDWCFFCGVLGDDSPHADCLWVRANALVREMDG